MTDREIMHKLLDNILDDKDNQAMMAKYTEFLPGIPGKMPALQKTYFLWIREASLQITRTEL